MMSDRQVQKLCGQPVVLLLLFIEPLLERRERGDP